MASEFPMYRIFLQDGDRDTSIASQRTLDDLVFALEDIVAIE